MKASLPFSLKNKWIIITGASSGIGAATALAFARLGAKLLLGARRVERLEAVAKQAAKAGARQVYFYSLDVAQTASVKAFMDWGQAKMKSEPLHGLINNAGGAHGLDTVAEGQDADWDAMIQSNFLGLLRMTRAALPLLAKDTGASIVNLGSIAGHSAYAGGSAYCGTKAAGLQITRVLRRELLGTGIRVGTVDPGMVATDFSLVRFKGDPQKANAVYADTRPLMAEDIAETIVWICSRPPHVNVDEILIKPTDQAETGMVFRKPGRKIKRPDSRAKAAPRRQPER